MCSLYIDTRTRVVQKPLVGAAKRSLLCKWKRFYHNRKKKKNYKNCVIFSYTRTNLFTQLASSIWITIDITWNNSSIIKYQIPIGYLYIGILRESLHYTYDNMIDL